MSLNITYENFERLDPEVLNHLLTLEEQIFPKPLKKEKIIRELSTKHNPSIFIAFENEIPVGYKVGFERSSRIYYSWIGGVTPKFRDLGIASELMKLQHNFAAQQGYKVVCTQTDNSFQPMIILNLKSGFEIKGTIQSTGDSHVTIVMEKSL
ncbi:MAG: GNAT family N-acetyltransferase [Bdellovibrionaceae bacterium]|nr:GNAT family N-acetyltransferase [Pseudobdellovibrionaceae bacterium]